MKANESLVMAAETTAVPESGPAAPDAPRPGVIRRLVARRGALLAIIWLALLVALALLAPVIAPYSPTAQNLLHAFSGPSGAHWLGTDDLGRDVLSRLLFGARISLRVSFEVVALALVIALPIGLVAGYRGGQVDNALMRVMDGGLSFPPLVLALAVVSVLGPGVNNTALALAVVFMPGFARVIRGSTLAVKEETFIEASHVLGTRSSAIVSRRVLPNVAPPLVVQASLALGGALLAEAALSFLGLGAQPPAASWGSMLREAYDTGLFTHPWSLVAPGAAIALAVLAFNTLGDGLTAAMGSTARPSGRRRSRTSSAARRGVTSVNRSEPALAIGTPGSAHPVSSQGPAPALVVRDLAIDLQTDGGPVRAVDGVSLELRQGEILGLVGESGSGKSLTSLAIMRLLPSPPAVISGGVVELGGRDLLSLGFDDLRRVRGREIGMVYQDPLASLNPSTRVGAQIAEVIRIHEGSSRAAARRRAVEMLDAVGIIDPDMRAHSYPHELSGGMRQRAMIAMALACRPSVLIADEPTTALDVTVQAQILDLLRRLQREEGLAVLFVTHDLAVVAEVCDRVAVMYAGQIVEQASVDDLFNRPLHPYTEGLLRSSAAAETPGEPLAYIPGQVPAVGRTPGGCRFNPRCEYATDACRREHPELTGDDGHLHRCLRASTLELRGAR